MAMAGLTWVTLLASAPQSALPPFKTQSTPQAVVNEHVEALNKCDWPRLMAQYPANAEIFLPNGEVVRGREAVGEWYSRNERQDFGERQVLAEGE